MIGQSLMRYQGPNRMKLEDIRRNVKLKYAADTAARSRERYGDPAVGGGMVPSPTAQRVARHPRQPPNQDSARHHLPHYRRRMKIRFPRT